MENFGKFMTILLSMTINPIIRGYVFLTMWGWFIVPTFNTNPLRMVEAIGIMFIVSYLTLKIDKDKDNDKGFVERMIYATVMQLVYSGLVLGVAWVASQFI